MLHLALQAQEQLSLAVVFIGRGLGKCEGKKVRPASASNFAKHAKFMLKLIRKLYNLMPPQQL